MEHHVEDYPIFTQGGDINWKKEMAIISRPSPIFNASKTVALQRKTEVLKLIKYTHTILYFMHMILPSPPTNSKS